MSVFVGNTEQVAAGIADRRFAFGFIEGPVSPAAKAFLDLVRKAVKT